MRRERSVFALTSAIGCAIVIFLSIGVAGMFSLFIPEYMAEYGYSKMEMSYVAMVATVSGFLFSLIGSKLINALGPKKSLLVGSLASAVFLCLIGSVDNLVALGLVSLAQGAVLGLACGVVALTAVMLLWNYLITPLYMTGFSRADVAAMLPTLFLPFNLAKGGMNMAATLLIYPPVVAALRGAGVVPPSQSTQAKKISAGFVLFSLALLATFVVFALVLAGVI